MKPDDDRIGRWEFQLHINETEPELWEWYDLLFDTFDMDGDHWVELHDLVHLYLEMDSDSKLFVVAVGVVVAVVDVLLVVVVVSFQTSVE